MLKEERDILLFHAKYLKQKDYWIKKLSGEFDSSDFLLGFDNSGFLKESEKAKVVIPISQEVGNRVITLSKGSDLSIYILLLGALKALLFGYTSNEEVITLSPVNQARVNEDTINHLLFIRDRVDDTLSFKELVLRVRQTVLEAYENQDYPFDKLVEYFYPSSSLGPGYGYNEVFSNILCCLEGLHKGRDIEKIAARFCFRFYRNRDGIQGYIAYDAGTCRESEVTVLACHFSRLLSNVIENIETGIPAISFLTAAEKKQLLEEFNNNKVDFCQTRTIYHFIEDYAEKIPTAVAVGFKNEEITYREINSHADRLAGILRETGIKEDHPIGILLDRSFWMLASILAIWKGGGAYIPLDPGDPRQRILEILKDSGARILITAPQHMDLGFATACHELGVVIKSFYGESPLAAAGKTNPNSLAYIIYTSGSTGKPKGAMVEHIGMMNHIDAKINTLRLTAKDIIAQNASHTFDISVWQFFAALLRGGRTIIYPDEIVFEPDQFISRFIYDGVTILEVVPSYLSVMLEFLNFNYRGLENLRYLLVTGETVKPQLVGQWFEKYPNIKMVNAYGPTEASDDITHFVMDKAPGTKNISIGRPVQNLDIYIVDKQLNLCPVGVKGEICVSGVGVGRGYLNNPELTAERFIYLSNRSYMSYKTYISKKIYKTGDLGRWLMDGTIEFFGRKDYQVKIRGFRIELGEIEIQLAAHPEVKEAAVIVREAQGDSQKYLCAFLVAREQLETTVLREYLIERLPDYMVPEQLVQLDRMPLTPNGKIDRKTLSQLDIGVSGRKEYVAPRDRLESKLVEIWSELLGIDRERIGIDSNFFELGGHSLNATIMTARIHQALEVKVPLTTVFENPAIRPLARYIKQSGKARFLSIDPTEKKEYYLLSPAQRRLYLLQQMEPQSTAYHLPQVIPLQEDADIEKLEQVFFKLVERHDSLRTSFHLVDDIPVQRIHDEVDFEIEYYNSGRQGNRETGRQGNREIGNKEDMSNTDSQPSELSPKTPLSLSPSLSEFFFHPFDLSRAPLLRVGLLKRENREYLLIVDMHHIITDGISQDILIIEFSALYAGKELPELRLQYKDFSEWQNSEGQINSIKQQEAYWLKRFPDEIPVLALPLDFPRPVVQSFAGDSRAFELSVEQTGILKRLAEKEGVTLYMMLLAVFNIFLAKITGQEDIIVGTPIAARRHADLARIIGMFVNTLALRNHPSAEKSFKQFLAEIKTHTLDAFENQEYPFEELVDKVSLQRDISRNPLFDVMFSYQNLDAELGYHTVTAAEQPEKEEQRHIPQMSKFDLTLFGMEMGEKLGFKFQYCTKLFKAGTIKRFIGYFKEVVTAVSGNAAARLSQIEIISEEEKNKVLYDFNDTQQDFPAEKPLHRLFAEQVEKTPDYTALVAHSAERQAHSPEERHALCAVCCALSYKELNQKSNQLAYMLKEKGVKPDTIVAIMVERSIEMIISILGILKAGGAYLPIDPEFPGDRIEYMLKDSGTKILLNKDFLKHSVLSNSPLERGTPKGGGVFNLAYVIYTSGSTGNPKGVMVRHRNAVNFIKGMTSVIDFSPGKRILALTTISFDIFFLETLLPLTCGLQVVIASEARQQDPELLAATIMESKINIIQFTPSRLQLLLNFREDLEYLQGVETLLVGGEAFPIHLFENIIEKFPGKIYNVYGPTETTIWSTVKNLTGCKPAELTIGSPIANTQIYIVNKHFGLQPPGVVGELLIGGEGEAAGYLNSVELTAEKFIQPQIYTDLHRFTQKSRPPRSPIYRTGDLSRWLDNGEIQFLGRMDQQVKIRGFRVELEEIETQLLKHKDIKEAVVTLRTNKKGDQFLAAYMVPEQAMEEKQLETGEWREYLSRNLPHYMIPSYFVYLESIPLTPNGKILRKALPEPEVSTSQGYTAPGNWLEEKLVEMWSEVLGIEKNIIGVQHNFFELGGHSLGGVILLSKMHKELNVKIPLTELFKKPTIKGLCGYIRETAPQTYSSINPVEKKEYYVLSSAQRSMYVTQQMDLSNMAYNMPQFIPLTQEPDPEKLRETFKKLILRHESLRTSFHMIEDEPFQRIHDEVDFEIEYYSSGRQGERETGRQGNRETGSELIKDFVQPFDLSRAPLLRVGLLTNKKQENILMVDIHHIISDAISQIIISRDFISLYEGGSLPPLRIQYKDFSEWQAWDEQKNEIKRQEAYWLREFKEGVPVLNIKTDYPRPAVQAVEGSSVRFVIDPGHTKTLKAIALGKNASLFMILLAIFYIFLSKVCQQEDITVGTAVGGRNNADLQHIVGVFVNMILLRNYPAGNRSFLEFLSQVRDRSLEAFENQDYPFEYLVEKLVKKRDFSRHPLCDVVFALGVAPVQPQQESSREENREINLPFNENEFSTLDITLLGYESSDQLFFLLRYCTRLYKKDTILGFIESFKHIVSSVCENPGKKLEEIELIAAEKTLALRSEIKKAREAVQVDFDI